jgi:isoleucyl-tRNA synthetase
MSKSLGNVIPPQDVMNTLGADILRLWIASTDFTKEMTVSHEILNRTSDTYRRIRNTSRFLLANMAGFNPETDQVALDDLVSLDAEMIRRTKALSEKIIGHYERYEFSEVTQSLHHFCVDDLGGFYLDIIKDRQYTLKADSHARKSCQTAMYWITDALVRWMAPILSFTAQEIWEVMPGTRPHRFVFAVTEAELPEANGRATVDWSLIQSAKEAVNQAIEAARNDGLVKGSLSAEVALYADGPVFDALTALGDELRFVTITSEVTLHRLSDAPSDALSDPACPQLSVVVSATSSEKCERCWHHRPDVGTVSEHPTLCARCVDNVEGVGEERTFA